MPFAVVLLLACAPGATTVDTAVVCPREFQQALAPWIAHRREQGHGIAVVSSVGSAGQIRDRVRQLAAAGSLRYLLLVGDADPLASTSDEVRGRSIPTHHARAEVNVQFGSEPEIATDNWYADLNDDRVPELAVGRLSADTPAELAEIVRKILAYEANRDFGRWRAQLHFVAGLGGFGPLNDALLEAMAKSLIAEGVPASYAATMTYASWQSPYCPDPRRFRNVAVERLSEGGLLWIYLGHGQERSLDRVRVPGASFPILACRDVPLVSCAHGAPIACFLSCYAGSFDQSEDCLAEDLLRQPGGPVAVYCGSRVTMPYAMTVMGAELLDEFFSGRSETIGQVIVSAKRRMSAPASGEGQRAAIEAAARTLNPSAATLEAERLEHLDLFNLLGDPLLRLPRVEKVAVEVPSRATAGRRMTVSGDSPVDGLGTVELVVRRGRLAFQPPRRAAFDPTALSDYDATYWRANAPQLATARVTARDGRFVAELDVPPSARGACQVRVLVEGREACAVGAAEVRIDAAEGPANVQAAERPAGRALK
jgi:hypothetical protein